MASEFLTLFTDASHCLKTMSAGWGAWAIRDDWGKSDIFGAQIPIAISSVNDAETYALSAALELLHRRGDLQEVDKFSLQCDNVHALGVFLAHVPSARLSHNKATKAHIPTIRKPTMLQLECARKVRDLVANRPIFLKHVKGHAGTTGRSWVNGQCDALAGRYMREVRKMRQERIDADIQTV